MLFLNKPDGNSKDFGTPVKPKDFGTPVKRYVSMTIPSSSCLLIESLYNVVQNKRETLVFKKSYFSQVVGRVTNLPGEGG